MPVVINDQTYYRTAEVCRMVGVSRNTLFRWIREGVFCDVEYRDWRGWRLFTQAQMEIMRARINSISVMTGRS
jgi:predicted site-specific integrase-resolvase